MELSREKATRHYGIDLLRIVAMLMVCVLHVNETSESLVYAATASAGARLGIYGWESVCLGAVNLYAMVTGYVCVTASWKPARYLRLWMQVAFYTIGLFALGALLNHYELVEIGGIDRKTLVNSFLPVPAASAYWYFTAYTALFLLIPFINPMLHSFSAGALRCFMLLFFVVLNFSLFFDGYVIYKGGYNTVWLLGLYVAGAYVRLHPVKIPRLWALAGFGLGTLAVWGYDYVANWAITGYTNPATTLSVMCLFLLFEKTQMRSRLVIKVISLLAPLTFGVYLVHLHPCVWALLRAYLPRVVEYFSHSWWLYVVCPVGLFAACALVDAGRALLFRVLHADSMADALARLFHLLWQKGEALLNKWLGPWFEDGPGQRS